MNRNNAGPVSTLGTHEEVMAHLESVMAGRPLSVDQKIQVLRDLMAGELGASNILFHDCCQGMISRLRGERSGTPESTIRVTNVRSFLAEPLVLKALMKDDLEAVVAQDVAFRVSCIEELGRMKQIDILSRQIGRVHHWKEGQALLRTLLYVTTPDQIFEVLQQFIRSQFSNKGWNRFGPDIYREESMDGLVNAVITRSDLRMLRWLSGEFRKGAQLMGLHPEQFDRYHSQITAALVACEVREDLAGLIDLKDGSHLGHGESAAFPVLDLPLASSVVAAPAPSGAASGKPFMRPVVAAAVADSASLHSPTRILPRPTGLTPPPSNSASSATTGSLLPPRGSHADDESTGFMLGDDGNETISE